MDNFDIEMSDQQLFEVDTKSTSIQTAKFAPALHQFAKDEAVLAKYGKKQQLRRGFGVLPVIGLTSTLMITWESITSTLNNGLENGGPAGLIYGYLFAWFGASLQALVMAEMASM